MPAGESAGFKEAPWLCVVPLSLTALGTLVLFFLAQAGFEVMATIFAGGPA
jgi:hypothetical protein